MTNKVPFHLLQKYFDLAKLNLESIATSTSGDEGPASAARDYSSQDALSSHRSKVNTFGSASLRSLTTADLVFSPQIVTAQLEALEETIVDSSCRRESFQRVLQEIGRGDATGVSFDDDGSSYDGRSEPQSNGLRSRTRHNDTKLTAVAKSVDELKASLTAAVESTNDLARVAFSKSVLVHHWNLDGDHPSHDIECDLDESCILEYCGLVGAAMHIPQVQKYLRCGDFDLVPSAAAQDFQSAEERLAHVQRVAWKALGYRPDAAMSQLKSIISPHDTNKPRNFESMMSNETLREKLAEYQSILTVAATNASIDNLGSSDNGSIVDDGTTRVVGVCYSEKIFTVPKSASLGGVQEKSAAAPSANEIAEHKHSEQRKQLDIAHQTSLLQQQIWSDFTELSSDEQERTLQEARSAQKDFLFRMQSTPPGQERILLMQSMSPTVQKQLVLCKLCDANSAGA